jgi:hypothetical protein
VLAEKRVKVELQQRDENAQQTMSSDREGAPKSASLPAFLQKSRVEAVYGQAQVSDGDGNGNGNPKASADAPEL